MSIRGRIAMGFMGLAMVAPAARAGDPDDGTGAPSMAAAVDAPSRVTAVAKHNHKGLFGWRHCTECQRARMKARDGVDIPAPPSLDPGVVAGSVAVGVPCPTCQGTRIAAVGDSRAAGYAAVGDDPSAPGFAVVGGTPGAEPAPVGMASARPHGYSGPSMAGNGPRPAQGPYDPSVVPTNIPPSQVALAGPGHDRPHIITNLFGLPRLGAMRKAQEDKERARHAAIAYGQANKPVTEIPSSMVYGSGGR